jgi:hypothetical protein
MNVLGKSVIAILILASSVASFADRKSASNAKIVSVEIHPEFNGDVVVTIDKTVTSCEHGFWLRASDAGFSANLSFVLSAFHAKSTVAIYGFDDPANRWGNYAGHSYCRLAILSLK